ncbi:hypothetical protein GCM10011374_25520 [Kocuria dechangensis]|uniref:Uncharacterized protein n=1 Tax=Kocuria dechangensis TaxID=1176249 RepID=A0A917LVZ7_9MICC|nr:hypothetical protein [Kocuria dechangensis]GGG61404.1 hypothetical protein GCM10011374_25520 [Kocuria dechangensis]
MNSTPDAPRSSEPDDDGTVAPDSPGGEAPDGLAGAEAAEQFQHAVEQRLSDHASEDAVPGGEAPETELDEDNPVSVDNPE